MGWAYCGRIDNRSIGYAVEATCDVPGCNSQIHRGVSHVCGTMHGGENGCGAYVCWGHQTMEGTDQHICAVCRPEAFAKAG